MFCGSSDLECSVEEMKTGAGLNHRLVTEQEVEQKSQELRRLGETLTKLKSECRNRTCLKIGQSETRMKLTVRIQDD